MPYVDQETRAELHHRQPENAGELCYILTKLVLRPKYYIENYTDVLYATNQYMTRGETKFARYAEVLGALLATWLELRRRLEGITHNIGIYRDAIWVVKEVSETFYRMNVGPYEETKITANGDLEEFIALTPSSVRP